MRASRQTAGTAEGAEEVGGGGGQGKVQVAANCSNQPAAKASWCKRNVSCCGYIASYQTGEEVGACSSGGAKRESTMIAAASKQAGGCTGGCRGKDRDAQIAPVGERVSRGEEG